VVGTAALALLERVRDRRLGRPPVYAPSHLVRHLLASTADVVPQKSTAVRWGRLARWVYGPTLGVAYAVAQRRLPGSVPLRGLLFGAAVCAWELAALPAVGATPALKRWPPGQVGWLVVQTVTFGVATALAMAAQDRESRSAIAGMRWLGLRQRRGGDDGRRQTQHACSNVM
jgi:hypothetical protein